MEKKKKTLADLKRDANTGKMSLFMLEWHGNVGEKIPARCKGIRKVLKANSVGLIVAINNVPTNGRTESTLHIESAKLVDYDGEYLTYYATGMREPTKEELAVREEWLRINEEYCRRNPMGDNYYQMMQYFSQSKYPYMSGLNKVNGKEYLHHNGMVVDKAVRGHVMLKYRVIFGECPLDDAEILERESALESEKTKYFYDENGDEYWYSRADMKKHYTKMEG